jgi:hypothetical protein
VSNGVWISKVAFLKGGALMARILKNWLGSGFAVGLVTACMVTLEVPETGHFLDNPVPVQAETEGQIKTNPDRQVETDVVPAVQQSDPALPAGDAVTSARAKDRHAASDRS